MTASTGMNASPNLPPLFELLVRDRVDSALAEARRCAVRGAEEGTLIWAREQSEGHPSSGGNLDFALVLRPEFPAATAMQLAYVAAVSIGMSLAGLVAPMTELRYRWPDEVVLNGARGARLRLEARVVGDSLDWLTLGFCVEVQSQFDRGASHARGSADVAVLEAFSRQFLSWINRWADEGFGPVRKAWMQRADGLNELVTFSLPDATVSGKLIDIDLDGAAVLEQANATRRVGIAEYFRIGEGG